MPLVKVDFPDVLLKKNWDKAKGLIAKKHETGIGEALTKLYALHTAIQWGNLNSARGMLNAQDKAIAAWPAEYAKVFPPAVKKCDEVKKLAAAAAVVFEKDKLVPKTATKAAKDILAAANTYKSELEDFEGTYAKALMAERALQVKTVGTMLKPSLTKAITKSVGLLNDIKSYAGNPTKVNFFKTFSGDANARGFTTVCKSLDQLFVEFPDIRAVGFPKGVLLMDKYFPGMADYGAEWSESDFEKRVNERLHLTGDDAYKVHARLLLKQAANIQEFITGAQKIVKAIN